MNIFVNPRLVLVAMEFCAVKDRTNNGSTLASRFAPHQVVSETGVSYGNLEETAGRRHQGATRGSLAIFYLRRRVMVLNFFTPIVKWERKFVL